MKLFAVATALGLALATAAGAVEPNNTRVYVARLRATSGVDEAASTALEEAVLVAAKKARPDLTVIGRSDVAALSDMVAEQAAAGCDAESCAAEIADALGAPQIVTGKLTRLGSTWILSLTRLERGSLSVLARESVEKQGNSAEVLIGEVPHLVTALLGDKDAERSRDHEDADAAGGRGGGISGLAVGGGVGLGAGVVTALGGGALLAWSFSLYDDARKADARNDQATVKEKIALGEPLTLAGWAVLGTGAVVAVVGGALLGVGLAE